MTLGSKDVSWAAASEHAWRYFELHASQRMTLFNYFTVLAGLMSAGIASTLHGDGSFAPVGVVLGLLLALLSFVFWKLDQRVSFLIKQAETVLVEAEQETLPSTARIFSNEPGAGAAAKAGKVISSKVWTFGSSFRLVFLAAGLIGLSSSGLSGLKAAGLVFSESQAKLRKTGQSELTTPVPKGIMPDTDSGMTHVDSTKPDGTSGKPQSDAPNKQK